jgi:hypothetical protein
MPRIAVQKPETIQIPLEQGDWIEVKKYLNYAEEKGLQGSGVSGIKNPDTVAKRSYELDFVRLSLGRFEAYITNWSFLGLDSKPLPCTPENMAALTTETAIEIDQALDVHVEKMKAAKNAPAPEPVGAGN